jgi:hypothetical protein
MTTSDASSRALIKPDELSAKEALEALYRLKKLLD